MIDLHKFTIQPESGVCTDGASKLDKEKVMRTMRVNSMFASVSDTFKFLAGITTTIGMASLVPVATTAITTKGFSFLALKSLSELGVALMGASGFGIILAAVACTAIAIGTQYVAQRLYQSGNFDALELNAQHTAKYLAKELKTPAPEVEHDCGRADGKAWAQAVLERAASQQQAARN